MQSDYFKSLLDRGTSFGNRDLLDRQERSFSGGQLLDLAEGSRSGAGMARLFADQPTGLTPHGYELLGYIKELTDPAEMAKGVTPRFDSSLGNWL